MSSRPSGAARRRMLPRLPPWALFLYGSAAKRTCLLVDSLIATSELLESKLFLHQQDFFHAVDFGELDFDDFVVGGLNFAAFGKQRIECGANCPAGIEYVVDQNNVHVLNGKTKLQFLDHGTRANRGKVVAIESYIESADWDRLFLHALDDLADT